ncbi:MAG: hypothetical protein QM731_14165 [Chitinophagaceae bacterium]
MRNFNFNGSGWFYIFAISILGWMVYANLTGWRIFTFNNTQTWSASGPGYHK